MQRSRGGAIRSSVEAAVIVVERRGGIILLIEQVNQSMGGAYEINKVVPDYL